MLRRTKSVSINILLLLIEPSVRHRNSDWGSALAVESVVCRQPLASRRSEHRAEFGVAIMQRVPPLVEKSPVFTRCIAGHLLHPCLIRMPGNPGQADAATLQMNEEQHVVRHQTTPCKDLDCEEINARQHRHMGLNEFLPGCCLAALRRRPNSMTPQNVPHAFIRHPIAEIGRAPTIRSYPQPEFCLAICTISASSFGSIRGLPG